MLLISLSATCVALYCVRRDRHGRGVSGIISGEHAPDDAQIELDEFYEDDGKEGLSSVAATVGASALHAPAPNTARTDGSIDSARSLESATMETVVLTDEQTEQSEWSRRIVQKVARPSDVISFAKV